VSGHSATDSEKHPTSADHRWVSKKPDKNLSRSDPTAPNLLPSFSLPGKLRRQLRQNGPTAGYRRREAEQPPAPAGLLPIYQYAGLDSGRLGPEGDFLSLPGWPHTEPA